MKKTLLLRTATWVLCLSTLLGACGLIACAPRQTPLLSMEGEIISVNHYQLLLCREKATAQYSGFTAWSSIADLESGKTYDELAKQSTLESAKLLLAALVLFEEEGLSLPDSTLEEIDQKIEDMKNVDAEDGSLSAFNRVLSPYGVNKDILRDIYIKEAKCEMVKSHLFGKDKISTTVQQQFMTDNVVAFKQILLPTYHYVYETDKNGDVIYYLSTEDQAKVNNIAYDTTNGYPRLTESEEEKDPTFETDKNGDTVYYASPSSDRIAYDKENGVRAMTTDSGGNPKIVRLDQAQKADLNANVLQPMIDRLVPGNYTFFENEMTAYYKTLDKNTTASPDLAFLYTMDNHYVGEAGSEMLSDIADTLKTMNVGDIRIVESESGYHIVMKYDLPKNAATDDTHSAWFRDLPDVIGNYLFLNRCSQLTDRITVDEDAYHATPSVASVPPSLYY